MAALTQSKFIRDLGFHVRASYPYLYVVTDEPDRMAEETQLLAESYLCQGAKADAKFNVYRWSITKGWMSWDGKNWKEIPKKVAEGDINLVDPEKDFGSVVELLPRSIFLMENFHFYLNRDHPVLIQMVRDLSRHCNQKNKSVVFMNSSLDFPQELESYITVLNHDLPTSDDYSKAVEEITKAVSGKNVNVSNLGEEKRYAVLESLKGMRLTDAENALAYSVVTTKTYDEKTLRAEKCKAIQKSGMLEFIQSDETVDMVGGLENLKDWLKKRIITLGPASKKFNLKPSKGIGLIGPPGTGKSLIAKATASLFKLPLIKFDFGNVMSKYVGESEQKVRRALQTIDSLAPCVLMMDEFEKAVSGSGGSGDLDSGVTMRTTGYFLQWLNDHTSPVFPIATVNRIDLIPVEMMRKGRFDELFFVDFPNAKERVDVVRIQLMKQKLDYEKFDIKSLAEASQGFNGAEIERAIDESKIVAANRNEFPNTNDVMGEMKKILPDSKKNKDRIEKIRSLAMGMAVRASAQEDSSPLEVTAGGSKFRSIDT